MYPELSSESHYPRVKVILSLGLLRMVFAVHANAILAARPMALPESTSLTYFSSLEYFALEVRGT